MADLHCGSCSNYFSDPRLLPCLHVFCKSCLESIKSVNEGTLTCPSCYKTTPTQDISTLPRHLRIEREVNIIKLQESSNEAVCGSCEENNKAEAFCIDCESPICSSCVNSHKKLKMLKNHSITSLDSAKPQPTTVTCHDHPKEVVKYYCSQCSCLICNECIIKHKDHNLMVIDEAAKREISKLTSLLSKFEQSMKPVGEAIESVTTAIEAIANKQEVLLANVEEAFQKIILGVEKRRGEIIGEINSSFIAQQTRLQMQKEELNNSLCGLKLALETTTMACNDYSAPEVLSICKSVHSAVESSLESVKSSSCNVIDDSCPEFRYDLGQVDKVILSFGELSYFACCPSLCSLVNVNPNTSIGVGCGIKSCLTLQARNSKGEDLKVGGADVKATIQRLNFSLECKVEDCSDGQYNIIFLVESPGRFNLHIAVDGKEIGDSPYSVNIIDYKGIKKSGPQTTTKSIPYAPQYAAWGEVTGSLYLSTNEGHVLVYDKRMNFKKEISKEKLGCKNLRGILVDEKEGTMLLANSGSHSIIKADLEGNVLMSVGERGNQSLQFCFPTGLGKTKEGLILVGDCRNKEVQILNPDLSYNSYIECHGQVWGVSVDRNNSIHIGTTEGVEVFKLFELNEYKEIAKYGYNFDKAGGIHFPNYQHADSTYSLVTDCFADDGEVILYNWKKDDAIVSCCIGDKPLGIAINQDGAVCVCCYGDNQFHIFGSSL